MSFSNRIFIYGPVGLLLALAAGMALLWKLEADAFDAILERNNGREVVPGVAFAFAEKEIGGFPFRLDTVLHGVTFAVRTPDGEIAWRTETLALHALTYGGAQFVLEASGLQSLSWPNGETIRLLYVTPALARASARVEDGLLARFDLDLANVTFGEGEPSAGTDIRARRAQFHLLPEDPGRLAFALKIEDAEWGESYDPLLGRAMKQAIVRGTIENAQIFDPALSGTANFFGALDAWRKAGGVMRFDPVSLSWGGVEVEIGGALTLDAAHAPIGALTAMVARYDVLIAAAQRRGALSETDAALASALADAVAGFSGDPKRRLGLPIMLDQGAILIAGAPVAAIGPLY